MLHLQCTIVFTLYCTSYHERLCITYNVTISMYIFIMQPLEQSLYNISKTSFLRDREKHRVDGALFIRTIYLCSRGICERKMLSDELIQTSQHKEKWQWHEKSLTLNRANSIKINFTAILAVGLIVIPSG